MTTPDDGGAAKRVITPDYLFLLVRRWREFYAATELLEEQSMMENVILHVGEELDRREKEMLDAFDQVCADALLTARKQEPRNGE